MRAQTGRRLKGRNWRIISIYTQSLANSRVKFSFLEQLKSTLTQNPPGEEPELVLSKAVLHPTQALLMLPLNPVTSSRTIQKPQQTKKELESCQTECLLTTAAAHYLVLPSAHTENTDAFFGLTAKMASPPRVQTPRDHRIIFLVPQRFSSFFTDKIRHDSLCQVP